VAIVRCKTCGLNHSRTRRNYVTTVKPVGYPDTAIVCGLSTCIRPGMVWLEVDELKDYKNGERIFKISSNATKIKVE